MVSLGVTSIQERIVYRRISCSINISKRQFRVLGHIKNALSKQILVLKSLFSEVVSLAKFVLPPKGRPKPPRLQTYNDRSYCVNGRNLIKGSVFLRDRGTSRKRDEIVGDIQINLICERKLDSRSSDMNYRLWI